MFIGLLISRAVFNLLIRGSAVEAVVKHCPCATKYLVAVVPVTRCDIGKFTNLFH